MKKRVYHNGPILTMDDSCPRALYVVTEGEKITALGSDAAALAELLSGDVEEMDLQGKLMLPGLIDSHLHMLTAALNRMKVDMSDMTFPTVDDMLQYAVDQTKDAGSEWVAVFGFSEENIGDGRMVTRKDIDRYFPDIPVTILRVCGHMCIVNSRAIDCLDASVMENIDGGEFKKDDHGNYTGLATEGAQQYVLNSMPDSDEALVMRYMDSEQDLLLSYGITSIHDAGTDMLPPRRYIELYEKMNDAGKLLIRTYLMARPDENEPFADFDAYLRQRKAAHAADKHLRIGSVKLFADGSFGSRTAAVYEPFADVEPASTGLLLQTRPDAYGMASVEAGHQVAIHAIGDRSTDYVANIYCAAGATADSRQRIEHAELMDKPLIDKVRDHNILIMTQPIFIREFGNTYGNALGRERAMHIQPIRSLLCEGITVGFGTDYPVVSPDPLLGIYSAMTRHVKNCAEPLNSDEAISFTEAVKCYTIRNAFGAFADGEVGSITVGKYADFAIFSGLMPDEQGQVADVSAGKVEMTILGGETVYTRPR